MRINKTNTALAWMAAALFALSAPGAHANSDSDRKVEQMQKKLDQSLELIKQLAARVQTLEAQVAKQPAQGGAPQVAQTPPPAAPPAAPAANGDQQRIEALEQQVSQIAAGSSRSNDELGMPMHGFADVGLGNHNAQYPEYEGFDIAELDFFLTPTLGAHTRALFELNFEVGEDGAVGVDLERAQIGYQFSDQATVWLGRFHTPFGFYNTAFHHGQEIATSLRRPRFLEFEDHGGVFPAHTVGGWLAGNERFGDDQKITYDLYVGNSQRITGGEIDMNNPGNTSGNMIFGGNLGYLPGGALDGLKVGVSAFSTRIDNQDFNPQSYIRVNNYGVYGDYETDHWEALAEAYIFDNKDLTTNHETHKSDAGFVQLGYREGLFVPYARLERAALQQSDDYFAAQSYGQSYTRRALGFRYDIDAKSAFKAEVANTKITDRDPRTFNEALIQYAIRF